MSSSSDASATAGMDCGQAIKAKCVGKTLPMSTCTGETCIEDLAQRGISEVVSLGTFAINIVLANFVDVLSDNQIIGLNALRCAFLNGFINVYNLVAAVFYLLRQFNQAELVQKYVDDYYPVLCTCQNDITFVTSFLRLGGAEKFMSCSDILGLQ